MRQLQANEVPFPLTNGNLVFFIKQGPTSGRWFHREGNVIIEEKSEWALVRWFELTKQEFDKVRYGR